MDSFHIICIDRTKSNHDIIWWRGGRRGYTRDRSVAGNYTKQAAEEICRSGIHLMIPSSMRLEGTEVVVDRDCSQFWELLASRTKSEIQS